MAPCNWVLAFGTGNCPCWDGLTPQQQAKAQNQATYWMWAATGRQFGVCDVTVRPCQPDRRIGQYRTYPVTRGFGDGHGIAFPFIDAGGQWRNCGCGSSCCCKPSCEVELTGPVAAITSVTVDGVVVPATDYRVDLQNGLYLLVKTTPGCWPSCQSFDADSGDGTFFVDYQRGTPVPQAVLDVTETLACEFAKAASNDSACRLPQRVTSIVRRGIKVELAAPDASDLRWITGLQEVDAIVATANPGRRASRGFIYSPDLPTVGDRITVIA